MTEDPITVDKSQTLADAAVVMTDTAIKSVVVNDEHGRPIGILTSTDFVRMATDGSASAESYVSEYMTADIVTTTPETRVDEAADLMVDNDISHLPVVGDDGRLAGIVTTTDVAVYVSGLTDLLPG